MTAAAVVSAKKFTPAMDTSTREEDERQAAREASYLAKLRLIVAVRLTIRDGDFQDVAEMLDLPHVGVTA